MKLLTTAAAAAGLVLAAVSTAAPATVDAAAGDDRGSRAQEPHEVTKVIEGTTASGVHYLKSAATAALSGGNITTITAPRAPRNGSDSSSGVPRPRRTGAPGPTPVGSGQSSPRPRTGGGNDDNGTPPPDNNRPTTGDDPAPPPPPDARDDEPDYQRPYAAGGSPEALPSVHNGGVNLFPYDPELREYIVRAHNFARAELVPTEAANMRQVRWDESLAIEAAELVDTCVFEHDTEGYAYGQNLMYGDQELSKATVDGWMQAWVTDELSPSDRAGNGFMDLDHASAVLWADTYLVGCASKRCEKGYLTACNYFTPGNWEGQRVYIPGASCSQCPSQAPQCDASGRLCVGDPSAAPSLRSGPKRRSGGGPAAEGITLMGAESAPGPVTPQKTQPAPSTVAAAPTREPTTAPTPTPAATTMTPGPPPTVTPAVLASKHKLCH